MKREATEILKGSYEIAELEAKKDAGKIFLKKLNAHQLKNLQVIIDNAESFKAVITVLATSFTKKIENPKQDVRFHKTGLKGGYSGRTFDTKFVTPFFKEKFHRLSMKESGWLTRSLEQVAPFDLKFPGEIRSGLVKKAFLEILDDVERGKGNPQNYLIALFIFLIHKLKTQPLKVIHIDNSSASIELIMESMKAHFFSKYSIGGASRLPVIAIYSIYQILVRDLKRYDGKKLALLKSHVTSDSKSRDIGDITVLDKDGKFFEGVEIKHGIPIDKIMVDDAFEKIRTTPTIRYYIITTSEPNIKVGEENKIKESVKNIRKEHGCEIIVNGVIHSLKYYLRLLSNPSEFIQIYTQNLEKEFQESTEIKEVHIKAWKEILEKNFS